MRANLLSALAAGAAALLLSTALASAELLSFSVELSGAAEVPPNDSPGTGMVTADYDTETKLFKWSISYQDLTGPATAAHFHGAANLDENAPPVLPVELEPAAAEAEPATSDEPDMPTDVEPEPTTEAEADGPAEIMPGGPDVPETANQIAGEATLTDEQAADLQVGKWYFNLHTAQYPDGEVRGQLPALPGD